MSTPLKVGLKVVMFISLKCQKILKRRPKLFCAYWEILKPRPMSSSNGLYEEHLIYSFWFIYFLVPYLPGKKLVILNRENKMQNGWNKLRPTLVGRTLPCRVCVTIVLCEQMRIIRFDTPKVRPTKLGLTSSFCKLLRNLQKLMPSQLYSSRRV